MFLVKTICNWFDDRMKRSPITEILRLAAVGLLSLACSCSAIRTIHVPGYDGANAEKQSVNYQESKFNRSAHLSQSEPSPQKINRATFRDATGWDDERWNVVTAKVTKISGPLIEGEHYDKLRILDPEWEKVEFSWPKDTRLPLKSGSMATLTILSSGYCDELGQWKPSYQIEKVVQDDYVLLNRTLCEVHGRQMSRRTAPIVYGLCESYRGIPFSVMQNYFPNGYRCSFGGCVVRKQIYRKGFCCPECLRLADKWAGDHGIELP